MSSVLAHGEARFDATDSSASAARRFLRERLSRVPVAEPPLEDGLLLASELVTNALLHARTELTLRYLVDETRMRIEVEDGNTRHPHAVATPRDATSGRGLGLVQALATKWGVDGTEDGKIVWFELPLEPNEVIEL
jgi:anti-sigma regulatory factor (Ser/Thr protein kinase)